MKNLIRTYVDPMLEDRIKILAESSGVSLSALTAELISKGLDHESKPSVHSISSSSVLEILYMQHMMLQILLSQSDLNEESFTELKRNARGWAERNVEKFPYEDSRGV